MTAFQPAKRLASLETGIFAALNQKKQQLVSSGRKVYDLSVGTPDFSPPAHVMQALQRAAASPENYKYSLRDLPEMLDAVVSYYASRFGVRITPDEVTAVHGSQEGIGHLGLALLNPGDLVLLPDPGYPIFEASVRLAEAQTYYYPLLEKNHYQPDFDRIPAEVAGRAKAIVVSYPSNPVCAAGTPETYSRLIAFAQRYSLLVVHDNAYSDILFTGEAGGSFLQYPGAKEIGVEFFSLSKSYNVTGARISFAIGNKQVINALKLLRSQIDFGMFIPVQKAAVAALTGPRDGVAAQREAYIRRRNALCGGLRSIGWPVPDSEGTMFVWAPVPQGFAGSRDFCMQLMEKTGVICTPGDSFGSRGEGYVRFALVLPPEKMDEVVQTIRQSGILDRAE